MAFNMTPFEETSALACSDTCCQSCDKKEDSRRNSQFGGRGKLAFFSKTDVNRTITRDVICTLRWAIVAVANVASEIKERQTLGQTRQSKHGRNAAPKLWLSKCCAGGQKPDQTHNCCDDRKCSGCVPCRILLKRIAVSFACPVRVGERFPVIVTIY